MWLCRVGPGKRKDCRMAIQNSFRIPCQSNNNYTSFNFAILCIKKLLNLHVSTVPKILSQRRWKTISIQEIYEQCTILLLIISKLPFTGTLHTTLAFCFILLPNSHLKPSHQVVDGPAWLVYMLHANLENQKKKKYVFSSSRNIPFLFLSVTFRLPRAYWQAKARYTA